MEWPHQPSVLRVRSPGLEAGWGKPTQPTILFDNRVITKGSRLKPLPQERVAGASPWAWSVRRRPTGGECGDDDDKGARPRAIAAQVLDAVLHRGRSLKVELAQALPALADVRDRALVEAICFAALRQQARRSEEHTSELQSLMRISYAVFCLKKKNKTPQTTDNITV